MQESAPTKDAIPKSILWIGLALLILPQLLFSSSDYIKWPRMLALVGIACFTQRIFPRGLRGIDLRGRMLVIGMLIVHLAFWAGGWLNGEKQSQLFRLAMFLLGR